jgi:hypothetical protein
MTVAIVFSPTIGGTQFADALQGGGTGFNFLTTEAGVTPTTKNIYARHDGANDITNLQFYVRPYSQAYGGEYSASADHTKLIEQGGVGSGFQVDFDWQGVAFTTYTVLNNSLGTQPTNAISIPVGAILRNNGGVAATASAPVQAVLGEAGDTVKGDTVLMKCRWQVPAGELQPGRRQIDFALVYNFTT